MPLVFACSGPPLQVEKARAVIELPVFKERPNFRGGSFVCYRQKKSRHSADCLDDEIDRLALQVSAWKSRVQMEVKDLELEIVLGIFCENHCGFSLAPELAGRLSASGIGILVFIYPEDSQEHEASGLKRS
jgi:hypothetical protein